MEYVFQIQALDTVFSVSFGTGHTDCHVGPTSTLWCNDKERSQRYLCGTFPAIFVRTMEVATWLYFFKHCLSLSLHDSYHPFSNDALTYNNKGTNFVGSCSYLRYVYFLVFMKEEYWYFPAHKYFPFK